MPDQTKKSATIVISREILEEARRLGLDPSLAAESGIGDAVRHARAQIWRDENANAIADFNSLIRQGALPIALQSGS